VGAHLVALRRTEVGRFGVAGAVTVDRLGDAQAVAGAAIEPLDALAHLPTFAADAHAAAMLTQGRPVPLDEGAPAGLVAVARDGALLAVGESASGFLKPRKVFGA
jgi:tRNA pseudouridine55 synthase